MIYLTNCKSFFENKNKIKCVNKNTIHWNIILFTLLFNLI